jgi:hypothetical protein
MALTHRLAPDDVERELSRARWTFAYMQARSTSASLPRLSVLLRGYTSKRATALKSHEVDMHSFFGLPYVNVSAHPRRIEKQLVLSEQ